MKQTTLTLYVPTARPFISSSCSSGGTQLVWLVWYFELTVSVATVAYIFICLISAYACVNGIYALVFIQDFCIECPSTGSLFSLKDGSIISWYPNNSVLRALTPQDTCRPLEIYPVKLAQDAIYVDVSQGTLGGVMQVGNCVVGALIVLSGPTLVVDVSSAFQVVAHSRLVYVTHGHEQD